MTMTASEHSLSDVERDVLESVDRFAEEVMRPAGEELDKLADPAEVVAEGSPLWVVHRRYVELGLDEITRSGALEPVPQARLQSMIGERLGWGDSGLAISLTVSGFHRFFAELSGNADLIARYADPDTPRIGCWAITEPDHGSDQLALGQDHFRDPSIGSNCVARLDGDEYVVNGQKSAWVSNGTIAEVATLFCTLDPSRGTAGGGVCIIDLDQLGVSRGAPLDKLGQRALNQGEIFFDDVRVPKDDMVVGPDIYEVVVEQVLAIANMSMGSTFVGVAQAAYEHALTYAKERIQGGAPIIEHQGVRSRLFKMFTRVEAARALARRVAARNAAAPPEVQYSIASKTFCTQAAFDVAGDAIQILGGNGLSREYPVEKLLRDARASMIEDGCNEILAIVGGGKL